MRIVASFQAGPFDDFSRRLSFLATNARPELAAALNAGGHGLRSATISAETRQTGLPQATITRAQNEHEATAANLAFAITSQGGNVRLKYFHAREGGGGVTASPWNRPTFYAGAFITSGRPGHRRPAPKLNGHVFENIAGGKWGGKIRVKRSGLFIPTEMTKGATAGAFEAGAKGALQGVIRRLASIAP